MTPKTKLKNIPNYEKHLPKPEKRLKLTKANVKRLMVGIKEVVENRKKYTEEELDTNKHLSFCDGIDFARETLYQPSDPIAMHNPSLIVHTMREDDVKREGEKIRGRWIYKLGAWLQKYSI